MSILRIAIYTIYKANIPDNFCLTDGEFGDILSFIG